MRRGLATTRANAVANVARELAVRSGSSLASRTINIRRGKDDWKSLGIRVRSEAVNEQSPRNRNNRSLEARSADRAGGDGGKFLQFPRRKTPNEVGRAAR